MSAFADIRRRDAAVADLLLSARAALKRSGALSGDDFSHQTLDQMDDALAQLVWVRVNDSSEVATLKDSIADDDAPELIRDVLDQFQECKPSGVIGGGAFATTVFTRVTE